MFPTYTLVLKITLFAVALGLTIATVVSVVGSNMTSPELLQELVDFVAGLCRVDHLQLLPADRWHRHRRRPADPGHRSARQHL